MGWNPDPWARLVYCSMKRIKSSQLRMLEAVIAMLSAIPLEFMPLLLHGIIYLKYDDRALQTHGKAIMESQVSCQD